MENKYRRKIILLLSITIFGAAGVFFLNPIEQPESYHHFADDRNILGIPNFWNVITNFPFLIIGTAGIVRAISSDAVPEFKLIYSILFLGVGLVSFGSGFYHYKPNNNSLVFDRIPMTIVFMSLVSATIGEYIDLRAGTSLVFPLVLAGAGSVLWWHFSNDLRFYGFVQFYSIIFIPIVLLLFPSQTFAKGSLQLTWVVGWYLIAKLFEHYDSEIYSKLKVISGHSLKHLAASISTWYLIRLFQRKHG